MKSFVILLIKHHHKETRIIMSNITYKQFEEKSEDLIARLKGQPDIVSVSIRPTTAQNVFYTDGDASGSIAHISIIYNDMMYENTPFSRTRSNEFYIWPNGSTPWILPSAVKEILTNWFATINQN